MAVHPGGIHIEQNHRRRVKRVTERRGYPLYLCPEVSLKSSNFQPFPYKQRHPKCKRTSVCIPQLQLLHVGQCGFAVGLHMGHRDKIKPVSGPVRLAVFLLIIISLSHPAENSTECIVIRHHESRIPLSERPHQR